MAGGVGLLIAGVGLLVQKLMELRSQQDEVIRQDNLYVQIGKEANAVTAKRIAEIETLRAALRSGNVAYDDKIKALERLKSIIPGYSAELEKTGRLVGENTKKVEEYIAALNKQAYAQAAQQRLAEAYNRKLDVELKMRDLQEQKKEVDAITAWDASAPAIGVDRSGLHGGLPAAIAEARTESRRLAAEIEPLDKQLKEVMAEIWGINMLIDENVDTLMLGVSGKKKDNAGAAAAEASELKAQEELQRLLRDVHGRTEKLRLELQEDGLRKRLAALDLEREQELAKIEERNRAIVAAYNKKNPKAKVSGIEGVDPQAAAAQKEAIAEMVAEWDKASEKIVADFARKQGDLADRRREVEEQYQRDIDELEKRNADGRYSEAIRSAEQTRDMELGKLDEQLITESGMWQRLFGDIESVSLRETAAIAARLREMVLSIADPEVKRRLTQMLDEVEDKVSSSGRAIERMFGNSKGAGVANLFFGEGDLSSKLSAFNDVFKGAEGSMEGAAEASGEMSDSAGKAAGAMSAAGSSASGTVAIVDAIIKNVHGAIQGVREVMAAIAEYRAAIGKDDSDSSFGQAMAFMENLGEFDEKVFSGWEKLKSGNVMGAITDNFLAYYELFTESARSAAAAREELEQYNRQQFLAEHEIERIAEERKVVEDEISKSRLQVIDAEKGLLSLKGADAKARAQETIALLKEQQYIAGKEEVKHKTKIFDGHFGSWSEVKNVMGDLSAYLSAANGDLGETVRLLEAIKKRGGLSDAQKDLLEDLKADYELALRYEEDLAKAQEERRELLTGTTRDGLLDGLKSGLSEGKKAFADFAGGAEDVLREALLSAVAAGVGGDELEKLYEELYSAVADGSFTEKEVEKFKAGYAQIGENMGKALEAINQAGIDVTGGDASLTGAVKTITEQTASLMAGQLNGIRVNVARQLEAAGQILAQVQQIRAATDEYLPFLEAISEGVARLNSGPESQTRAA
jgi:hypothetical protein